MPGSKPVRPRTNIVCRRVPGGSASVKRCAPETGPILVFFLQLLAGSRVCVAILRYCAAPGKRSYPSTNFSCAEKLEQRQQRQAGEWWNGHPHLLEPDGCDWPSTDRRRRCAPRPCRPIRDIAEKRRHIAHLRRAVSTAQSDTAMDAVAHPVPPVPNMQFVGRAHNPCAQCRQRQCSVALSRSDGCEPRRDPAPISLIQAPSQPHMLPALRRPRLAPFARASSRGRGWTHRKCSAFGYSTAALDRIIRRP